MSRLSVERLGRDVIGASDTFGPGWERWVLVTGDWHWDHPHCNRDLLRDHLEEARRREAGIIHIGDLFCVMQGTGDPRRSKDDIRPEHNTARYLDSVVESAVEWLAPYADLFIVAGYGNHETKIIKHQETDVLRRWADLTNALHKAEIQVGGYGGAVRFGWNYHAGGAKVRHWLYYEHGYGGGGPVTKGAIQDNRRMAKVEGVDFIVSGHVHELRSSSWERIIPRHGRTGGEGGKGTRADRWLERRRVEHLVTGTYKDESPLDPGFHSSKGAPFKPLGSWWIRFLCPTGRAEAVDCELVRCDRWYGAPPEQAASSVLPVPGVKVGKVAA